MKVIWGLAKTYRKFKRIRNTPIIQVLQSEFLLYHVSVHPSEPSSVHHFNGWFRCKLQPPVHFTPKPFNNVCLLHLLKFILCAWFSLMYNLYTVKCTILWWTIWCILANYSTPIKLQPQHALRKHSVLLEVEQFHQAKPFLFTMIQFPQTSRSPVLFPVVSQDTSFFLPLVCRCSPLLCWFPAGLHEPGENMEWTPRAVLPPAELCQCVPGCCCDPDPLLSLWHCEEKNAGEEWQQPVGGV